MASGTWERIAVDGREMATYVATAQRAKSGAPWVAVAQHAGGVDRFVQGMCDRLAADGFSAAAPNLYHRQEPTDADAFAKMANLRDEQILTDFAATVDWIESRTAGEQVGLVGFCMGGRVAYLVPSADRRIAASVSYYEGNTRVAWGDGPAPFERLAEIRCPILGLFGEEDRNPTPDDRDAIDQRLSEHRVPHEFHSFANAGHAYMDFTRPERHSQETADASWPLTIAFLEQHIGHAGR